MKQISLPTQIKLKITIDPQAEWSGISCNPKEYEALENLGMEVVRSAIAIESLMNHALRKTLFRELTKDAEFVCNMLLESDKLTFKQKKTMLVATASNYNLLSPPEMNLLDKDLSFVIRYRNAFAHGTIATTKAGHVLCYFSSKHHEDNLSEPFWSTLETTFQRSADTLYKLHNPTYQPGA